MSTSTGAIARLIAFPFGHGTGIGDDIRSGRYGCLWIIFDCTKFMPLDRTPRATTS